jgi:hypothetical protein
VLIGKDFDKIEISVFGFDLVEPNAFIGDSFILIVALFLASRVKKIGATTEFFKNWRYFYLLFGFDMFFGGIGHLMFKYWGFNGKYLPWILGIFCIFFVERAMLSLLKTSSKVIWKNLSLFKLLLAFFLELVVFYCIDMSKDHSIGLRIPAINSAIGFIFSLVILGNKFRKEIDKNFIYMIYGVLLLIPSALFISFKINIHPWFDKNDFGHLLLIIAMFLYFKTIKSYSKLWLSNNHDVINP